MKLPPSHELPPNRASRRMLRGIAAMFALALVLGAGSGCTRRYYRLDADRDAYFLIRQKENDPRWNLGRFNVYVNRLGRFFDPYDPDRSPMPQDDPASHVFMERVDGMRGSRLWNRDGVRPFLESPDWRENIKQYAPVTEQGKVKLDVNSSVDLAVMNQPSYQSSLEEIYLSALDVSTERFRFQTQFYGGIAPFYNHQGALTSGRPQGSDTFSLSPAGQFQREFAAGGEAIVGFANSFVWQFAGPDSNSTNTLVNYSLVQPLLKGGGRAVALEQLTIAERALLANLRAFERYRQGFYTQIAVGQNDTVPPRRRGGFFGGTGLTGFTGQGSGGFGEVGTATGFGRGNLSSGGGAGGNNGNIGFAGGGAGSVGGFIGLLQDLQQIRNTETSLKLMVRTLSLLEANLEAGIIDIAQVDQFRQNIESERAVLLQAQIGLENDIETFVRATLGLPPDLPVELDDSMVQKFWLIDPQTTALQDRMADLISTVGNAPASPSHEFLDEQMAQLSVLRGELNSAIQLTADDLAKMDEAIPARAVTLDPDELAELKADRQRLSETLDELKSRFESSQVHVDHVRELMDQEKTSEGADELVALASSLSSLTQELSLVQARARLEAITIEPVSLDSETALSVARVARLDWMNNRAALVDSWRLITYNANALRSNLTVMLNGDLGTVGNNPTRFRDTRSNVRAGVQFDPPFTRLLERNNYRQVLIDYQRDRRTLIQYEDAINQTLRQDLRQLRQLAINLEIQRRAVAIAARRVDQTAEVLNQPPPLVAPGQPAAQLGPTAALNLITALSDLRNSQNNFMSVWLNYYAQRMTLMRDLGVMELDDTGHWIDRPLDEMIQGLDTTDPLPPDVPQQWLEDAGLNPQQYEPKDEGLLPETLPPAKPLPQPLPPPTPSPNSGGRLPPLRQPHDMVEPRGESATSESRASPRHQRQPAYRRVSHDVDDTIACLPGSDGDNELGSPGSISPRAVPTAASSPTPP